MKFNKNNLQESDSTITLEKKSRKKTEWKENEDNYLRKYIKKFRGKNSRIKWRLISAKIQEKFAEDAHQYTPKACKDRYNHYLKEGLNLNKSTEDEMAKLMELTKIYGNQWSIIAQQMNNRTEQFVKNKFYALVRKIFRKLIQIVFKKRNSSKMTNSFKAHIISNFICFNNEDDFIPIYEKQIKQFAQELIFDNLNITKQSQINQSLHDKLIKVLEFMEKKNDEYIKQNKRVSNKNNTCKNLDEALNCFQVNQKPQNCFFQNCNGEKIEVPLNQSSYKVLDSYTSQNGEHPNLASNCSQFLNFYSYTQVQINSIQNYHLSQF